MPYIKITTNKAITKNLEDTLKDELGQAIEIFPGKSERWLMISFHGGVPMAFSGSFEDCCMVEIDIFGSADEQVYDKMTAAVSDIISRCLKISPERIYTKYSEFEHWGNADFNF